MTRQLIEERVHWEPAVSEVESMTPWWGVWQQAGRNGSVAGPESFYLETQPRGKDRGHENDMGF